MKYIDSLKNPRIKQWKKLQGRKEREKLGLFIVEGFHLVEEAIKNNVVDSLLITEETNIPYGWDTENINTVCITEEIVKHLSETETPQQVLAICKKIEHEEIPLTGNFLLVDAVQDPGNLGTMIRTADAAGVSAVILGNGCVDLYNSKTLRSTQGSLFHLPIIQGNLAEWIPNLQDNGVKVYGTALENAKSYTECSPSEYTALVVGNEGSGMGKDLLDITDENLFIPLHGKAESLNVSIATGILLYFLRG